MYEFNELNLLSVGSQLSPQDIEQIHTILAMANAGLSKVVSTVLLIGRINDRQNK